MVEKTDGWMEDHFNDPRMIAWQDVVVGLQAMGLDMRDNGDHVIEVRISAEHLVIERTRRGMFPNGKSDPHEPDGALWSVTKDILMRPRRES